MGWCWCWCWRGGSWELGVKEKGEYKPERGKPLMGRAGDTRTYGAETGWAREVSRCRARGWRGPGERGLVWRTKV